MTGQLPARYLITTLRSPFSSAPILMLLGAPARRTTWHSVMPSATPPPNTGAAAAASGSSRSGSGAGRAGGAAPTGMGAPARSPAMVPTGRSAGAGAGSGATVAATGAAGGAAATGAASGAQRPSAATISSGATGPLGPRWILSLRLVAHSGASKALNGFEKAPL